MSKPKIYILLILCGLMFLNFSDLPAQKQLDSLLQMLPQKSGIERCDLLQLISKRYFFSDTEKSLAYAQEALKIAEEFKDEKRKAVSYFNFAYCFYRNGNYPEALSKFSSANEIFIRQGDKTKSAEAKNMMALIYSDLKRFDVALDLINQLLSYYNEIGDQRNYASVLINASNIFLEKKEFNKALEGYFNVLEINKRINSKEKEIVAIVYCNIGEAYYGKKQFDLSYKYRRLSLDLYKELNFTDGIANLQMDIGMSLMKLKDFTQSRQYLTQALENYKSIKYAEGVRKTLENFVILYRETQQFNSALTVCIELEGQCNKSKDSIQLARCYKMFGDIYLATSDFKLASEYYNKYVKVKEIIDSKENKQRMFELQTVFQTEEQEFENKALRQENELQREKLNSKESLLIAVSIGVVISVIFLLTLVRKEKKIRRINEQIQDQNKYLESHLVSKDKFFSILAHNLKNPFWAVLGQNKMLEDEYDDLTEKERKELIKGIGSSAGNVYKLFEDLLKWAKSQQNTIEVEKEKVNVRNLVKSSIRPYELIAENKKIKLEVNVREEIEIEVDKFMMETVIGNLVDNAIKFSLQEDSVIVSGYRVGEEIEIMVQDYGMGISREKLEKLFKIDEDISTAGTMNERGTGLGLIICKEFVEKHGGGISVDSKEGKGTTFSIILPCNYNSTTALTGK